MLSAESAFGRRRTAGRVGWPPFQPLTDQGVPSFAFCAKGGYSSCMTSRPFGKRRERMATHRSSNTTKEEARVISEGVHVRTRILILFIVSASTLLFAGSPFKEQGEMTTVKPRTRAHATAKVTLQSSEAQPYDQTSGPALMEIHLNEKFTGDIDGESPVRALQVLRSDRTASLVSVQRFHGKLGGREGKLRASRFRNRRERKDQGDMVRRTRIGNR